MDPSANLAEQLQLATAIRSAAESGRAPRAADAVRLAELVLALQAWMFRGGFLPGYVPLDVVSDLGGSEAEETRS